MINNELTSRNAICRIRNRQKRYRRLPTSTWMNINHHAKESMVKNKKKDLGLDCYKKLQPTLQDDWAVANHREVIYDLVRQNSTVLKPRSTLKWEKSGWRTAPHFPSTSLDRTYWWLWGLLITWILEYQIQTGHRLIISSFFCLSYWTTTVRSRVFANCGIGISNFVMEMTSKENVTDGKGKMVYGSYSSRSYPRFNDCSSVVNKLTIATFREFLSARRLKKSAHELRHSWQVDSWHCLKVGRSDCKYSIISLLTSVPISVLVTIFVVILIIVFILYQRPC